MLIDFNEFSKKYSGREFSFQNSWRYFPCFAPMMYEISEDTPLEDMGVDDYLEMIESNGIIVPETTEEENSKSGFSVTFRDNGEKVAVDTSSFVKWQLQRLGSEDFSHFVYEYWEEVTDRIRDIDGEKNEFVDLIIDYTYDGIDVRDYDRIEELLENSDDVVSDILEEISGIDENDSFWKNFHKNSIINFIADILVENEEQQEHHYTLFNFDSDEDIPEFIKNSMSEEEFRMLFMAFYPEMNRSVSGNLVDGYEFTESMGIRSFHYFKEVV
ncbi:MAG: hypothetical protein JXR95_04120 [Deltaproteobacteria bacterium]|nr:hypothetical protein [Deltaproteobacteria bacterium]